MTAALWKGRTHFLRHKLFSYPRRLFTNESPEYDYPPGLFFWPKYFTTDEQRTLLVACLHKLDNLETRQARKKQRNFWKSTPVGPTATASVLEMFAPDELYNFEEGHYDGVIRHFREMHLSSWPVAEFEGLQPILERLYTLCPTPDVQTHLLHLASHGEILPHIDNIDASGSWILGVSLGAQRTLRMQKADNSKVGAHRFILDSGSVYLQRDCSRYNYLHSIERGQRIGQRLSIVIRDRNSISLSQ